jgi:hypothetical protein
MNAALPVRYARYFLLEALFHLGVGIKCLHGHKNHLDARYCEVCAIPIYSLTPWARGKRFLKKQVERLTNSRLAQAVERVFDRVFFPDDAKNQPLPVLWQYHRVVVAMLVLLGAGLLALVVFAAVLLA